jgi:hypothetical protein
MNEVKEKAEAIIKSCITCEHLITAKPYLELFLKQFGDIEGYEELVKQYEQKTIELNCEIY